MMIEKEKYILRTWQKPDAQSLAENADNKNIWNNVRDYFPHPYGVEDANSFIDLALSKNSIQDFAIVVDGKAVGGIGFIPGWDVERLNAEVGYWLGETHWGKGIMPEVLKDVADFIFQNTEIIRLYAPVFEFNIPSMRVLEKTGFRKLAVLNKAAIKNGRVIDMHYFELLK